MAWLQLSLESTRESAKRLSELLERYGAISVSLSALSDEPLFAQDYGWECHIMESYACLRVAA